MVNVSGVDKDVVGKIGVGYPLESVDSLTVAAKTSNPEILELTDLIASH